MTRAAPSGRTWPLGDPRQLRPGQHTEVWIASVDGRPPRLVHTNHDLLLEAPNWSPDGQGLLLNGDGALWHLDLKTVQKQPARVDLAGVPPLNNDHVVDPTGDRIYVSANDGHIWVAPLAGGSGLRVTSDQSRFHFLHGISPDGKTLAFVEIPVSGRPASSGTPLPPGRLALLSLAPQDIQYPKVGNSHLDGPEFSPDGRWVYVNTEEFTSRAGHAQLARLRLTDGRLERLLSSPTVDWFPHLSPDGSWATYLRFPAGTLGHPADLPVSVELVRTNDWATSVTSLPLFGGQGTLNVNSWSPNSDQFAYVAYPLAS